LRFKEFAASVKEMKNRKGDENNMLDEHENNDESVFDAISQSDDDLLLSQVKELSCIYRREYLNKVFFDQWRYEGMHQMNLRHQAEMNEIKKLHAEQKQELLNEMKRRRDNIRRIQKKMQHLKKKGGVPDLENSSQVFNDLDSCSNRSKDISLRDSTFQQEILNNDNISRINPPNVNKECDLTPAHSDYFNPHFFTEGKEAEPQNPSRLRDNSTTFGRSGEPTENKGIKSCDPEKEDVDKSGNHCKEEIPMLKDFLNSTDKKTEDKPPGELPNKAGIKSSGVEPGEHRHNPEPLRQCKIKENRWEDEGFSVSHIDEPKPAVIMRTNSMTHENQMKNDFLSLLTPYSCKNLPGKKDCESSIEHLTPSSFFELLEVESI
jgi:hypothetical protein